MKNPGKRTELIKAKWKWSEVYRDGHDALWNRALSIGRFHYIKAFHWEDTTGEKHEAGTYHFELREIDIFLVRLDVIRSAIEFHDAQVSLEDTNADGRFEMIADALNSYGAFAPMGSYDGNNYNTLVRQARYRSAEIEEHTDLHGDLLDAQVNKIGNTARDFMTGNVVNRNAEPLRTVHVMYDEYCSVLEEKLEEANNRVKELTAQLQGCVE